LAATTLVKQAWVPATFRKMRHSWRLFAEFLQTETKTPLDLLGEHAQTIAANFKAYAASRYAQGATGAVLSHTSVLLSVFEKGGGTLHRLLNRAVHRKQPKRARKYSTMWDVKELINWIRRTYPDNTALSTGDLLRKTIVLTMIFSASRITELSKITVRPEDVREDMIRLDTNIKTRLEEHQWITFYPLKDKGVCPHAAIQEWLSRRTGSSLVLFTDPSSLRPLSVTAISSILRSAMRLAGVGDMFAPYSIKHAVITFLFAQGVPEAQINEFGRWSVSSRVAYQHYRIATSEREWPGYKIAGEDRSPSHPQDDDGDEGPNNESDSLPD
jgi:site-specific recombinase XerD